MFEPPAAQVFVPQNRVHAIEWFEGLTRLRKLDLGGEQNQVDYGFLWLGVLLRAEHVRTYVLRECGLARVCHGDGATVKVF